MIVRSMREGYRGHGRRPPYGCESEGKLEPLRISCVLARAERDQLPLRCKYLPRELAFCDDRAHLGAHDKRGLALFGETVHLRSLLLSRKVVACIHLLAHRHDTLWPPFTFESALRCTLS